MPYYHLNSTTLSIGSTIEPGNWGRIVRLYGLAHGRFALEAAMEDVRRNEFPHLPSRLDCSFFFEDIEEARFYANSDTTRALMLLYEIDLVSEEAVIHRADWRGNSPDANMSLDWARRYWRGTMMPPHVSGHTCQELLAISPLRIVQKHQL